MVGTFREEMPVEYVVKFCQYIEGKFDHGNEMFKPCTEEDECCKKEDIPADKEQKCCSKKGQKCCSKEGKKCCSKEDQECCCSKEKCCKE